MATRSRREKEYAKYVIGIVGDSLGKRRRTYLTVGCPSPGCNGMVQIVVDCSGESCTITAHCKNKGKDCDFPTLSGKVELKCEGNDE